MARCNCSGTCSCLVLGGIGTEVSGSGSPSDPYIIDAVALQGAFQVQDTTTVDLNVVGSGTSADPYILSAHALSRLTDLVDRDTSVAPQVGMVPVWQGTNWVFAGPPVAPAGAVNATNGITGNGAVTTPLRAATSGVWGVGVLSGLGPDSTVGSAIYVDSAGQLRTAPNPAVDWNSITNKPAFFPTTWDAITGKPTTFPTTWTQVEGRPKAWYTSTAHVQVSAGATATVRVDFPPGYFNSTDPINVQLTPAAQISSVGGNWTLSVMQSALTPNTLFPTSGIDVVIRPLFASGQFGVTVNVFVVQAVGGRF